MGAHEGRQAYMGRVETEDAGIRNAPCDAYHVAFYNDNRDTDKERPSHTAGARYGDADSGQRGPLPDHRDNNRQCKGWQGPDRTDPLERHVPAHGGPDGGYRGGDRQDRRTSVKG